MVEETLFTKEGYDAMLSEYESLVNRRPEIAERLKEAIAFGDLSENSEYDAAKNEQAELEDKILKLETLIKTAKVIQDDEVSKDVVRIGQKVKIRNTKTKEEAEYVIVNSNEADPIRGKISNVSPIGAALIDKKVKAKVEVKLPNGIAKYEIMSIG